MKTTQPGDHVAISICHRDHVGRVLAIVRDSQPSPYSSDLICRIEVDGRVVLRRLSELRAVEIPASPPAVPLSDEQVFGLPVGA